MWWLPYHVSRANIFLSNESSTFSIFSLSFLLSIALILLLRGLRESSAAEEQEGWAAAFMGRARQWYRRCSRYRDDYNNTSTRSDSSVGKDDSERGSRPAASTTAARGEPGNWTAPLQDKQALLDSLHGSEPWWYGGVCIC